MLFNEPKLLKFAPHIPLRNERQAVSVLFNEPKLLKCRSSLEPLFPHARFSALQRAEIAEILLQRKEETLCRAVSVLFNEPKLLKYVPTRRPPPRSSAVSVLFNEPKLLKWEPAHDNARRAVRFSALQRAEIAEIAALPQATQRAANVSVLFNEPKLLKSFLSAWVAVAVLKFQCSSTSRNC